MGFKAVNKLTERELAGELEQVARMLDTGAIGSTLSARSRMAALLRRSSVILKKTQSKGAREWVR
jgi:hypothetical protein